MLSLNIIISTSEQFTLMQLYQLKTWKSPFWIVFCDEQNIYSKSLKAYESLKETLQWRHNKGDHVSNHQPHDCLLNCLFRRRSKKTSQLRVTGLCAGNSPVTSEFPAQRASSAENVSIWWRHHDMPHFSTQHSVSWWTSTNGCRDIWSILMIKFRSQVNKNWHFSDYTRYILYKDKTSWHKLKSAENSY